MSKRSPEEKAARAEADALREVRALHRKIEKLAGTAKPKEAGDLLLGIARQKIEVAGLGKRHSTKIEAHVGGPRSTDEWLAKKLAEDEDEDE